MINILQSLSLPGLNKNEDLIWYDQNCVVLLDGSTSLIRTDFDAVWFVNEFIKLFSDELKNTKDLCQSINCSIKKLYYVFLEKIGDKSMEYYPSASAVFIYQNNDKLQIVNLGDCTTLVFNDDVKKIYSNEVEVFDNQVISEMVRIHEQTDSDISQIVKSDKIREMLITNRKKMNQQDGYRILSFNMRELTEDDILEISVSEVNKVITYSDGFNLLEEDFYKGNVNLNDAYNSLRALENMDKNFNKYPRFKISDDASAVVFNII